MRDPDRFLHRAFLTLVLVGSGALSAYWAYLVPVYQAPDEPAHLDYALCVASAGRLLNAREAPSGRPHPYTQYLLSVSGVMSRPQVKVPADYGTASYFQRLDRQAPSWDACPGNPVLVPIYPFGYYAALAAWLGLARLFHDGLSTLFFAARAFSVLLLMTGLMSWYYVAREMRLSRGRALLLVTVVGFFPLASFVSSYVQPDNMVFTLLGIVLYLALVLRRQLREASPTRLFPLGLALGLLLVTKLQFFLCSALAILAMLATSAQALRFARLHPFRVASALLLPAVLAGSVQAWVYAGSGVPAIYHTADTPSGRVTDFAFRQAWEQGMLALLTHMGRIGAVATLDYYVKESQVSFWGRFGWMDTPLIFFGSPAATQLIRRACQGIILLVLTLNLFRLGRTAIRFSRLAVRGHARCALSMACADPVHNSYLLFTLFMITFYVYTANTFGAQGRNWFPFLPVCVLMGTVYAPRALPWARVRTAFAGSIAVGWILYCMLGSYYAMESLKLRYYAEAGGPSRQQARTKNLSSPQRARGPAPTPRAQYKPVLRQAGSRH